MEGARKSGERTRVNNKRERQEMKTYEGREKGKKEGREAERKWNEREKNENENGERMSSRMIN